MKCFVGFLVVGSFEIVEITDGHQLVGIDDSVMLCFFVDKSCLASCALPTMFEKSCSDRGHSLWRVSSPLLAVVAISIYRHCMFPLV